MNRSKRAKIARETLKILEDGFYFNKRNERINIEEELKYAVKHSIHYKPEMFNELFSKRDNILNQDSSSSKTDFEVTNETTLGAVRRQINEGQENILCLNFASAKNPGGGFLKGSGAQEESLARATGMYPCISQMNAYYSSNKKYKSALYTDNMIYSPNVPVLRDDRDELLDAPVFTSIITAPAVNAKVVRNREPQNTPRIKPTMMRRIEKILSLAIIYNHKILILGAWGCGVFKNNPSQVAEYFARYLMGKSDFSRFFNEVVFAILDKTKAKRNIAPFEEKFLNESG
ncbi:MAG: TIGR02452 family protein [Candidatus Helarchaeota archaeon]|nr:TIGR02452 family protein [Candidatus Helarchaeota archaeon]